MSDSSAFKDIKNFVSENYKIISIVLLLAIVFLGIYVRTGNLEGLKDVTTGEYTLGPDLDPFLYLREAKQIVNGSLENPNPMWSAPLGNAPYAYSSLMPWTIVGLYKILYLFNSEVSIEFAAVILPLILTVFAIIFFFLFVQKAFSYLMNKKASYFGALLAAMLYAVVPQMLHRTTQGVPEIESLGMPFFWLAFYFFLYAWKSEKLKESLIFAAGAGISTGLMIWSWGGFRYIFMAIALATFTAFFFQKIEKKNVWVYAVWLAIAVFAQILKNHSIKDTFMSLTDIMPSTIILVFLLVDMIKYDKYIEKIEFMKKIPRQVNSIIISFVGLAIIASVVFGPMFVPDKIMSLISSFLHPFGEGRIGLTVAENKAPYFVEISGAFAVSLFGKAVSLFWLFFFGAIAMFYFAIRHFNKKYKRVLNLTFIIFLIGFIFSRISPNSALNGVNFISKLLYFGSLIFFVSMMFYVHRKEKNNLENSFYKIDFSYLLLLAMFFFTIISMRGAIRLLFIISPFVMIGAAYLTAKIAELSFEKIKEHSFYPILGVFVICILIVGFTGYGYAMQSKAQTTYSVPGMYEQQWQKAMSWVRENTNQGDIFVHWWDYGYWVQTIGGRPTVTDGGHAIDFWDHTTARYLMTAENEKTTLQLLKAHNVSYVLFDSTDINKYGAFASIASDATGEDRLSYIPTFVYDEKQSQESKNQTLMVYTGGFYLDDDFVYNGKLLPRNKAAIIAFIVYNEKGNLNKVEAVVYYNGQQIKIPVNYVFIDGNKIKLDETGFDGVFYFVPLLNSNSINKIGAGFFLSKKVANGQFARMYLLGETNMSLAYKQDSELVRQVNQAYSTNYSFVVANQVYGPISIFKVPNLDNVPYYREYLEKTSAAGNFAKLDYLGR